VDYESHAVTLTATSSARCWWPPGGSSGKTARCAGIGKTVTPHTLRHAVTASLDAGVPLRDLHMSAGCAAWPAYLCAGGQIGE
jgi:hypothetical protein